MVEKLSELAILDTGNSQQGKVRTMCRICPGFTCTNLDGPTSGRQIIIDGEIVPPPEGWRLWNNINRCEILALGRIESKPFILPPPASFVGECPAEDCFWKKLPEFARD